MPCEIIGTSSEDLQRAAEALSAGRLVAIPTETVYGLGGNAWHSDAVQNIFSVKSRPASDPLICHVDKLEKGLQLWASSGATPEEEASVKASVALATFIGNSLWPGPLTIVCKANPSLSPKVTGSSGFVGLRIPNHPLTLKLLSLVDFPVAAPSANTFGHVSPTSAQHVYDDLAQRDPTLLIIDGGKCGVGIESTVIKITEDGKGVEMLRRGRVTVSELKKVLERSPEFKQVSVTIRDARSAGEGSFPLNTPLPSDQQNTSQNAFAEKEKDDKGTTAGLAVGFSVADGEEPMDSPGQLLTHYSPRIPASLLTPESFTSANFATSIHRDAKTRFPIASTVIIDFKGVLRQKFSIPIDASDGNSPFEFKGHLMNGKKNELGCGCFGYTDLSVDGSPVEATAKVFDALRWAELSGGSNVVFPSLSAWKKEMDRNTSEDKLTFLAMEELLGAVEDRLFRAASGVIAEVR